MRRALLLPAVVALAAFFGFSGAAHAHPLGNFSVNHLTQVSVSADRVDVRYVLDEAEVPTFQQRTVPDAALLARKQAEVRRRLAVTADGRRLALRPAGPARLTHPPGQGGLKTTRVEIPLSAAVRDARSVVVRDGTFPGRVGWKAVIARPGRGTAVKSSVPAGDPTNGLRRYPEDLLDSPADTRSGRFAVAPGTGTLSAPDGARTVAGKDARQADEGLTKVFGDAAAGRGVLLLLLLAAFGWGAVHALSPGHGKAMVAAYLVGTRGTPRHAVALGLIVTATHTAGVFALGGVTLALSAYVLPETLYPWLNLLSGVLVVGIGAAVLRSHLRRRRAGGGHAHAHHHDHSHGHDQHHSHGHEHASGWRRRLGLGHHHHHDGEGHDHSHLPTQPGWRGLLAMGAAAGLIPCPSALVVLLGAIAQGQVLLGMLLIVAFSAGLATTLTVLGLAVVWATRFVRRVRVPSGLVTALPAASAVVIVGVGCVLTARALPLVAG